MHFFTDTNIAQLISQYGYVVIFPISIVEGPIVAVISGFFVSLGHLNFLVCALILELGDIIGDLLYYALGRYGGRKFMSRFGKYIGITEERVLRLEKFVHGNAWKFFLFGKTQAIGSAMLFTGGFVHMPFKKFIIINGLASVPKVLLFLAIGYFFGSSLSESKSILSDVGLVSFILGVILLGSYFALKRYIKKHEQTFTQ